MYGRQSPIVVLLSDCEIRRYSMPRLVSIALLTLSVTVAIAAGVSADTPGVVALPAPVEWATAPAGAPAAPGDAYAVTFADSSGAVDPAAPAIAEWNKTVKPGESFTLTGVRLTSRTGADSGTDTIVWVWANTSSGGLLKQAKIWRVDGTCLSAAIPDDLPFGMYLVWVENSAGASAPVCINRTIPQWIGPLGNVCSAGDKKRVFGKNISYGHGTAVSYAYIQPAAGGPLTLLTNSRVEPFDVEFTIPAGTPNGNYKIYVHNGHGGQYGWGDPLTLTVQSPWVRGSDEIVLSPNSGGDDTGAIITAMNTMSAKPNGGTVRLSAGTFTVKDMIWIKDKVRFVGAGMDNTTIAFRLQYSRHDVIKLGSVDTGKGTHISVEDMTWKQYLSAGGPQYSFVGGLYPDWLAYTASDQKFLRLRITNEFGVWAMHCSLGEDTSEIGYCELYGMTSTGTDGWTHDNKLYGGPLCCDAEAAAGGGTRNVFEHNYVATPNWPYDATQAKPYNYAEFDPPLDMGHYTWARRVFLGSIRQSNQYIGWTTSNNVAVQDNRGEQILLHGYSGAWFGQCLSQAGTTTTVRTDGYIDGAYYTVTDDYGTVLQGGIPVPDTYSYGYPIDGMNMVIISGPGVGQCRLIVSHTSNTITVDKPWRVAPDSTTKAIITPTYSDFIVYKNDMNGFPLGYVQSSSASVGMQISDGWQYDAEGNTSRRTRTGRQLCAGSTWISMWNTMRDEQALSADSGDFDTGIWDSGNPVGTTCIGNRYIGGLMQAVGPSTGASLGGPLWMIPAPASGNIFEGVTGTGGDQGILTGQDSIFLNNAFSLRQVSGTVGARMSQTNSDPIMIGNTYSNALQTYSAVTGNTFAQKPLPEYRVARFAGYVGQPVGRVAVPIANAGIAGMNWAASPSDSWITASVISGPTVAAEAETGRLVIGVDTTGMSAGKHWGYVDINASGKTARIGVCVVLASGSGNSAPVAAFTATPLGGTAPMTVTMNAGASVDTDGTIVSYAWDFGDGTTGSGSTVSHTYTSPLTYGPTLVVTDDDGAADTAYATVTVAPALTSVTLSGTPKAPVTAGTAVTLSATAVGGYQVQYKFVVNSGSGWTVVRDYASGSSTTWTPSVDGYYRLKVYVKNTGSVAAYDIASNELGYPVGLLPSTGMVLWLRGDIGVTYDSNCKVTNWADQSASANNASQSYSAYRPTYCPDSGNGSGAVTFAAGNVIMSNTSRAISGNSSFTCFAALKYNGTANPSNNQFIFWNGLDNNTGGYGMWLDSSSHLSASWGFYDSRVTDTDAVVGGQWYIFTTRYGGGSHQAWVNGTLKGSPSKSNSNMTGGGMSVGNKLPAPTQGFNGDIQEMIVYTRALTDVERSGVESYLATKYQPQVKTTIPSVKALPDGSIVSLTSPKVATASSATFSDGGYYIEEPDRSCGIRVTGQTGQAAVSVGDRIAVSGMVGTDGNGEKLIAISAITSRTSGDPLGSLGMTNKSAVPGLLITVWGKVKEKTSSYLTLDDGSGTTIRVQTDGLGTPLASVPDVGAYIRAAGPCGMTAGGVTVVRVRADSDIQVY